MASRSMTPLLSTPARLPRATLFTTHATPSPMAPTPLPLSQQTATETARTATAMVTETETETAPCPAHRRCSPASRSP